ncbi:MAG: PQQ-dependent sugar dehydrogenase [Candidatus Andeanibacterium colombiense]|uniref:PQQ-dependent sugar dehydrogenase n=1 Tax=Candidatus Andeanibacterium colombiense TaxID=3121345 RepID=A0AAJ6BQE6_9SPHN|nr:MAG: PQQ-dependent sugar dehydrogenase [Sphingomonadaceae bacterium]
MDRAFRKIAILASAAVYLASCNSAYSGDNSAAAATPGADNSAAAAFDIAEKGSFEEPWALAFEPGTGNLFVTEKKGAIKFLTPSGALGEVSGIPAVSYGGQGGFADIAFAPDYTTSHTIYISWVQAGEGDTRRGAVGRGKLECSSATACSIVGLKEIWHQGPALSSFGQFALRLAFSPDAKYLFVASGDLAKGAPAQDLSNNLGKTIRLNLDGTPAAGNPFAGQEGKAPDIWSYGHRNPLGFKFDEQGRLWDMEHGPAGGDELNLVEPGKNYGWPLVSNGDNYDGTPIPRNSTRPDLAQPAISWNPVIAPGDFIFYSGELFPEWRGNALIAGLKTQSLVRVRIDGNTGTEVQRIKFTQRLRDVVQGPDGAIWVVGDGPGGKLLKLTPKS